MTKFYFYIARKISTGKGLKNGFSRPIVQIAKGAVALGIAVMIIAIAIVIGFQNEVRDKVVGFGSHVQVTENSGVQSMESVPMVTNDSLVKVIENIKSVKHVQRFAVKPGILETKKSIEGAVIKGVSWDFDWSFFQEKMIAGEVLQLEKGVKPKTEILLSETIAKRLSCEVGDKLTVYFVQNQEDIKPRTFRIKGIYNSGFVEFDEQFVFVPLEIMAKISQWGIEAQVKVEEDESGNNWLVEGFGFGGEGQLRYVWSEGGWKGKGPHALPKTEARDFSLIVKDRFETIPDSAFVKFKEGAAEVMSSGGTHEEYTGGYEVILTDYQSVLNADDALTYTLPYYYRSDTILSRFPEIFSWLNTLDINVVIIIVLMIFVAIINIASAILIIIIEKTNLIGLFKAFGATGRNLSGLFFVLASRILVVGLVIGNVAGIGFCVLQQKFKFLKLDPEKYILSHVPVHLDWGGILQINLLTLAICLVFMLLPVLYVAKIDPVRAIKFD